jgi:hypothetical protein
MGCTYLDRKHLPPMELIESIQKEAVPGVRGGVKAN